MLVMFYSYLILKKLDFIIILTGLTGFYNLKEKFHFIYRVKTPVNPVNYLENDEKKA